MADGTSRAGVPGPARRLRHEQILDVALEVLAAEGVAGLSLRRLATRLDVSHMALYRYYPAKDALLDAIAGHALPDLGALEPDRPWDEQLHEVLVRLHDAFSVCPGVAQLMALHSGTGPRVDATRERIIALLLAGGLSPAQAISGLGIISRYLAGSALVETGTRRRSDAAETARLAALPVEEYPVLASLAEHYLAHDADDVAERGIDLLVDSFRRQADGGHTARYRDRVHP